MAYLVETNEGLYAERLTKSGRRHKGTGHGSSRDWWLPKYSTGNYLRLIIRDIVIPPKFEGKRFKIKLEMLEDEHNENNNSNTQNR